MKGSSFVFMSILSGRESSVNGKCQLLENDTKQYCSLNGAVMLGGLGSRHLWKFFLLRLAVQWPSWY